MDSISLESYLLNSQSHKVCRPKLQCRSGEPQLNKETREWRKIAMNRKKSMSNVKTPSQVSKNTDEDVKANYNKLSRWYDVFAGNAEQKYKDVGLRKLNVKSGEKVLEIGYGTGQCLLPLAQAAGHAGKVYGVDISEGMAGVAKTKVTKVGLSQHVELICADAILLPYSENSMHAIFMSFTLELFDTREIPIVLAECHRVLAAGGRILHSRHGDQGRE